MNPCPRSMHDRTISTTLMGGGHCLPHCFFFLFFFFLFFFFSFSSYSSNPSRRNRCCCARLLFRFIVTVTSSPLWCVKSLLPTSDEWASKFCRLQSKVCTTCLRHLFPVGPYSISYSFDCFFLTAALGIVFQ